MAAGGLMTRASGEGQMKVKIAAVLAATMALSITAVGSAAAQPLGPADQHESARPPQVSGVRLQAAMLPPSAFGAGFTFTEALNSGAKLQSTRIHQHVPSMSCGAFEGKVYISTFGDTAGAVLRYSNPAWFSSYPNTIVLGDEYVLQFATEPSAATFYSQAQAKYAACLTITQPFFKTTAEIDTLSVAKTTISGDKAFVVIQRLTAPGYKVLYLVYLYVVAGTNVYGLSDISGTNDVPSHTLMRDLMHRVQALYPH
jgi:hypothetical protein